MPVALFVSWVHYVMYLKYYYNWPLSLHIQYSMGMDKRMGWEVVPYEDTHIVKHDQGSSRDQDDLKPYPNVDIHLYTPVVEWMGINDVEEQRHQY